MSKNKNKTCPKRTDPLLLLPSVKFNVTGMAKGLVVQYGLRRRQEGLGRSLHVDDLLQLKRNMQKIDSARGIWEVRAHHLMHHFETPIRARANKSFVKSSTLLVIPRQRGRRTRYHSRRGFVPAGHVPDANNRDGRRRRMRRRRRRRRRRRKRGGCHFFCSPVNATLNVSDRPQNEPNRRAKKKQ